MTHVAGIVCRARVHSMRARVVVVSVRAKGRAGRLLRLDEAACAARRLPCGARPRGPSHNSLRCAPLEQMRRVRARGALPRAATRPPLLGASYALRSLPAHPFAGGRSSCRRVVGAESGIQPHSAPVQCGLDARIAPTPSQKLVSLPARLRAGGHGSELGGAEQHRARGRARSAPRALTRRCCLSGESAANAASSATGHETEQRREPPPTAKAPTAERTGPPARSLALARPADRHS